jgi:hypothetical protein
MEWARTALIDGRSLFNIAVRDEAKRGTARCEAAGPRLTIVSWFTFHASRFDKLTAPNQVEGRVTVLGSGPRTT